MSGRGGGDLGQHNNISPIDNFAALSAKNQRQQNWGKFLEDAGDGTSRGKAYTFPPFPSIF